MACHVRGAINRRQLDLVNLLTVSAALDISGHLGALSGAKSAPRGLHAVLSSSDREPTRAGAPRAKRSDYAPFRRETPRTSLAGHLLTANQEKVRGEEEWLPGLMSQSAVVRDYRALEIGRRRANRLVLTISG
jgi:hypothetical protein